jgi:hypothetical protein
VFAIFCGVTAVAHAQVCEHDFCVEGVALNSACDPCVTDICAVDAYCCDTEEGWWDNLCVEAIGTVCGSNACDAACAHSLCEEGEALDATCNACAADVCQADPTCCTTDWDATCVGLVETACGNVGCEQGGNSCQNAVALDYYDTRVVMGTLVGMPAGGCASEGASCNNATTWYSVSVPADPADVRYLWTCGSDYSFGLDSVLSLHTGCPGEISNEVMANDDWKFSPYPLACWNVLPIRLKDSALAVPFNAPGGATYKIRVSHFDTAPETPYQLYLPEPSSSLLGGVGLATVFALSRWRSRRRGRRGSG